MSYVAQPRKADHEKVKSYGFRFKPIDEKPLEHAAEETGKCYCPSIGKELEKFWLDMIPPREIAAEGLMTESETPFASYPLPLYLYSTVNPYLNKMEYFTKQADTEYHMKTIAPEWYFKAVEKFADINLANDYIVWVLSYYNEYIKDEVSRKFWQKRFPWIMEERRKHFYIVKKVKDRIFEIRNEGIMSQEDLIFMYFVFRYLYNFIMSNLQSEEVLFVKKIVKKGSLAGTDTASFDPLRTESRAETQTTDESNLYNYKPMYKASLLDKKNWYSSVFI